MTEPKQSDGSAVSPGSSESKGESSVNLMELHKQDLETVRHHDKQALSVIVAALVAVGGVVSVTKDSPRGSATRYGLILLVGLVCLTGGLASVAIQRISLTHIVRSAKLRGKILGDTCRDIFPDDPRDSDPPNVRSNAAPCSWRDFPHGWFRWFHVVFFTALFAVAAIAIESFEKVPDPPQKSDLPKKL